jgi:hypothetical protein
MIFNNEIVVVVIYVEFVIFQHDDDDVVESLDGNLAELLIFYIFDDNE